MDELVVESSEDRSSICRRSPFLKEKLMHLLELIDDFFTTQPNLTFPNLLLHIHILLLDVLPLCALLPGSKEKDIIIIWMWKFLLSIA